MPDPLPPNPTSQHAQAFATLTTVGYGDLGFDDNTLSKCTARFFILASVLIAA